MPGHCIKTASCICAVLALLVTAGPGRADSFAWAAASPESLGLDSVRLAAMVEELAARGTKAVLVLRRDRVACEWYAPDHGPEKRHYTASLAKALVGGMSLLLALDDGRLGADDPACRYIPGWRGVPLKQDITIRHLATHSSGIEDAETPGKGHFEQTGWKLAFWKREPDPFSVAVGEAPVLFPPGERYDYSNPGMAALAYAVTASLRGAPESDIFSLLKRRVMDPIGVPEDAWSMGYDTVYQVDGLKLYANWGGGSYTARAVARVGRLMMRRGDWDGQRLIDSAWVERVIAYAGTPLPDRSDGDPRPGSGLAWYTNFDGVWPEVPRDAFAGAGAGNQVLLVVPSLDLVVVRNGSLLADSSADRMFWGGVEKYLFNPLMEAVYSPPLPASPVIRRIVFDPAENILRRAEGSDNWPITWAGDGCQYTAYGDGWGFEPTTEIKLSNGLARISGTGTRFRGENIRSADGETGGDGPLGEKASGMLSVDGTLYMWLRNADNSRLLWSADHGRTWKSGFRFTPEENFGCPAFLNCGQDYSLARDEYVYIYSQDGPSAYRSYDRVALARVHRDSIARREAYRFFRGPGPDGGPAWTREIRERAGILEYPGRCRRLDVVYNPGIGRYLMALAFNDQGGWGIFDAPQPWGPWTTAFYTDNWGLGQTHGYRIPAAWIAADGKSFHLVFSGRTYNDVVYDAFCVRAARIETVDSPAVE